MSSKKPLHQQLNQSYASPTEYLTMQVDGALVTLHFKNGPGSTAVKRRIEDALLKAENLTGANTRVIQ